MRANIHLAMLLWGWNKKLCVKGPGHREHRIERGMGSLSPATQYRLCHPWDKSLNLTSFSCLRLWPWTHQLTILSLNVLTCKMGIIMYLAGGVVVRIIWHHACLKQISTSVNNAALWQLLPLHTLLPSSFFCISSFFFCFFFLFLPLLFLLFFLLPSITSPFLLLQSFLSSSSLIRKRICFSLLY